MDRLKKCDTDIIKIVYIVVRYEHRDIESKHPVALNKGMELRRTALSKPGYI